MLIACKIEWSLETSTYVALLLFAKPNLVNGWLILLMVPMVSWAQSQGSTWPLTLMTDFVLQTKIRKIRKDLLTQMICHEFYDIQIHHQCIVLFQTIHGKI